MSSRPFWPGHPHLVVIPVTFGPRITPRQDAPGAGPVAAELAVISVLNGNLDLASSADRRLVLDKLAATDSERRSLYTDYLFLSATAESNKLLLEEDMATTTYRSPFINKWLNEGRLEGRKQQLRETIGTRGFVMDPDSSARIDSCADDSQLKTWAIRAVTASSLDEIFAADLVGANSAA
jgi:hypothetical protein